MPSARAFRPINPGAMRFVGDLEQAIPGTDDVGSPLACYQTFASQIRFDFADYRGDEILAGKTIMASLTTYIMIRYRPGLDLSAPNTMRLKHVNGEVVDYYDINAVLRDRTMRWALQLQCTRRDSAGYRTGEPTP